jgi:hypothetical protein
VGFKDAFELLIKILNIMRSPLVEDLRTALLTNTAHPLAIVMSVTQLITHLGGQPHN